MADTREFTEIRAELSWRIEVLEAALKPLADLARGGHLSDSEADRRSVSVSLLAARRAREALENNTHPSDDGQSHPLDQLVPPDPMVLGQRLLEALQECALYQKRGWRYWFRQASMLRLEELGMVEPWRPEQLPGAPRRKKLPWRPTESGLRYLKENPT